MTLSTLISVLRLTHALFTQASQTAVCNRLHPVEERRARWLLAIHDRVGRADQFPITHEFMARMLGVNRATVSLAAAAIQRAGYIRYARGKLIIISWRKWPAGATGS